MALLVQETSGSDQESDLQLACLNIECKCGEAILSDGDKLYICKNAQCQTDYYCENCGRYHHRTKGKKKPKNHRFNTESNDVVLLNQWITNLSADEKEFEFGKKQLIQLIGLARYNKIAPYVEKPLSLAISNGAMCAQLVYELKDFFNAAQTAIDAASAATNAANAASKAATAAERAWAWGQAPMTYIYDGTKPFNYDAVEAARKNALFKDMFDTKSASMQATKLSVSKTKEATAALNSTMSVKDAIKSGAVGMAIATGIEMSIHGYRYAKGQISGKEWCRLLGKSICRNTLGMFGTAVGGKFGATVGVNVGTQIGTVLCPGIGTFVGGATGIFVGILFGYLMGKGAEVTYEYWLPSKEESTKSKVVEEALLYFNFEKKDVLNGDIFNKQILKKKFRQKALWAHPDRRNGDHAAWYKLSQYYGILKGLLEQKESDKEIVQDTIASIHD